MTNALNNANAEQQQQAQSAPPLTSSPLPPPPEINPLVPTPGSSPTSVSDINALTSTATYKGSMAGVLSNGDLARGSYQNVWNFGSRSGVATVTFGNTPNTFQRENSSNFGTNQPLPSTSGPARSLELNGGFVSLQGNVAGSQAGNFSITGPGYNVNGAHSVGRSS